MFRPKIGKCSELDDNRGKVHAPRQHSWRGINSTQHMFFPPNIRVNIFTPAIDPDTFFTPKIHPLPSPCPRKCTRISSVTLFDRLPRIKTVHGFQRNAWHFIANAALAIYFALDFAKNDYAPPPPPPSLTVREKGGRGAMSKQERVEGYYAREWIYGEW